MSEFIQIEVQCNKNYFKIFLLQEATAFGNNIEKEPEKPLLKLKKYFYYIFTENICSGCDPMQVVVFLQVSNCNGVMLEIYLGHKFQ